MCTHMTTDGIKGNNDIVIDRVSRELCAVIMLHTGLDAVNAGRFRQRPRSLAFIVDKAVRVEV